MRMGVCMMVVGVGVTACSSDEEYTPGPEQGASVESIFSKALKKISCIRHGLQQILHHS